MKPLKRLRAAHSTAFTLVELLVVIGIIALLIGILLPTLGRARERANIAKCAANMRSAVQATQLYVTGNRGWLPGPSTSGLITPTHTKGSSAQIGNTDTSADTQPIQNMDWVSPTLGLTFRWPENDMERLRTIFLNQLACPSNRQQFSSVFPAGTPTDLPANSYSAVVTFFTFPSAERSSSSKYPPIANDIYAKYGLVAPPDYTPKITRIGPPSKKVFLVEGTRSYEPADNQLSFNNLRYQVDGGNFMICPPFTAASRTPYQRLPMGRTSYTPKDLVSTARTSAWHHDKGHMNMAFFDGHVELRDVSQSIQVDLYVPPGTKIVDASVTFDPSDKPNQVISN